MLAPDMATMLAFLTTDAGVEPGPLADLLRIAVRDSFNSMTVDGCTSTNDTVILMASGRAGPADPNVVVDAVTEACTGLAAQMVADAEGASKIVHVRVTGAASGRRSPPGRQKGGRLAPGQVLPERRGPLLGAGGERPRLGRGGLRDGPVGHRLRRGDGVPGRRGGRPRRGRPWPSTWPARSSTSTASSAWPTATAWSWVSTSATATSTRIGPPRDRDRHQARPGRPSSPGTRPPCWWSRFPTSAGSGTRWWWSSTAATCSPPSRGSRPSTRRRRWPPSPRTSC